jgi:hypothetical protein
MEIIKEKTRFQLSKEDREVLEKTRDMIRGIFYEISGSEELLGYNEEEIGQTYYMLGAIVEADDRELVIEEA